MNRNNIPYFVTVLSLIGLITSIYLAFKSSTGGSVACPIFEGGCDVVLKSEYSEFLGIHLSVYGIVFYLGILLLTSYFLATKKELAIMFVAIGSLTGFVLSVIFIGIQGILIGTYCFYCMISAITSTLLFITTFKVLLGR